MVQSISSRAESPFVQRVIDRWVHLIECDWKHSAPDIVPFFKKSDLPPPMRFNLPRVERDIMKVFQSHYRQYSWLPNELDVEARDVFRQDKRVASWYIRPKPFSGEIDPDTFLRAFDAMVSGMEIPEGVQLKSVDRYIDECNKQSSSCYPLFRTKNNPDAQSAVRRFVDEVLDEDNDLVEILDLLYTQPVFTFHRFSPKVRSKLKKVETKIRLVFGYPFGILALQEMIHGDGVDRVLKNEPFCVGMTRPQISDKVKMLRESAVRHGNDVIQMDIQGMDYRLPAMSVYFAHAFLIELNRLSGVTKENTLLSRLEEAIAFYEVRTPVIGSWKSCLITNGGTKSGTRFNTFANSIMLELATRYHYIRRGYPDTGRFLTTIGYSDDKDAESEAGDTTSEWNTTMQLFHMHLHPDKSKIDDPFMDLDFLGMTWHFSGAPDRSLDWICSKLVFPERFIDLDYETRFVVRATSILAQISSGLPILMKFLKHVSIQAGKAMARAEPFLLDLEQTKKGDPPQWTRVPFDQIIQHGWKLF